MKWFILLLFILVSSFNVSGQKFSDPEPGNFYKYKNELGINFTNVLGNVLSLNPNNANSPYGLTYRKHFRSWTFRTGFDILLDKKTIFEFTDPFNGEKEITIRNMQFRVGGQKNEYLSQRFVFGYGIDLLFGNEYEFSKVSSFTGINFDATESILQFGAGPVLRLEYKLSDRIFLSTESTLYAIYGRNTSSIREAGLPDSKESANDFNFQVILPQSLFFNIAF